MPIIVAGPGIEPGTLSRVPIAGWDILPTLADLAGHDQDFPADVDGVSFAEILSDHGAGGEAYRERPLIFHRYHGSYPHSSVIRGNYKLVKHWKSDLVELFDLSEDIGETKNLADSKPQKVRELYESLVAYLKEVDSEILQYYKP